MHYHQLTYPGEGMLQPTEPVETQHDPRPLPPWTKPTYPTFGCSREKFKISKKNLPANLPYRMDNEPCREGGRYSIFWNTFFCNGTPPVDDIEPGDLCFNQAQSTLHMYNGEVWVEWKYPLSKEELLHHPHFPDSRFLIFFKNSILWYSSTRVRDSHLRQGGSPASPHWLSDAQMIAKAISRYRHTTPYDGGDVGMGDDPNAVPEPYEDHQETTDNSDDEVEPERLVKRRRVSSQSDSTRFDVSHTNEYTMVCI